MTDIAVPTEIQLIVDALDDKRARDIRVLDLSSVSDSLDYFVVATGDSTVQLKALEDGVKEHLKANGFPAKGIEGPSTRWTLLNYGTIAVHLMSPDAREFYDLEGLWADAEQVEVTPA